MSNAERRVTVQRTLWPHLQALAKRDGVTVADVANAILLQTLSPYSNTPCPCLHSASGSHNPVANQNGHQIAQMPDPYSVAAVDSW